MEGHKKNVTNMLDIFVNDIFDAVSIFPRDEIYVTAAQLKRSSLSVVLNYIEGFARSNPGDQRHFLRIAYGSLKETEYLITFSIKRKYMSEQIGTDLERRADTIGAILYSEMRNMNK
jgi:four helix bundle protein